jgi:hypothetical protein
MAFSLRPPACSAGSPQASWSRSLWSGWNRAEEHTIVAIFGWSLGGFIAAMVVVIIGLLVGGPVGRFKVEATRDGVRTQASVQPTKP